MKRRAALPVDTAFARAVLERVLAYRTEAHRNASSTDELALAQADAAALHQIIGALEAQLDDRDVRQIESRVAEFDYTPASEVRT